MNCGCVKSVESSQSGGSRPPRCRTTAIDQKRFKMHYAALVKTDWLVVRIPPLAWGTFAILAGTVAAIATVLLLRS